MWCKMRSGVTKMFGNYFAFHFGWCYEISKNVPQTSCNFCSPSLYGMLAGNMRVSHVNDIRVLHC